MANRLADETSPYLQQHADNPVHWYPWGPEALERAREEDRPILLSVGYSSCHWCHVMERESFEDASTAALMNRHFVNVKVDREERPDIDQVYMKAVQAMTGGGGWPMTVFLTPDLVPFFGGTYYPPEPRPGMPSFSQVLEAVADAFANRREQVEHGGARLVEALARTAAPPVGERSAPDRGTISAACRTLEARYDSAHGGFGAAPKFPQPVTVELLLRHHLSTGEPRALEMALHTLRAMASGGLRDHLAGGFHRYSVDARWLVPHFEKMLYDNALLARTYLDGWRITGADDLREVCVETLDYLLDDMLSPEGGFYSARDADSEGAEGTFYLWTPEQIDGVLRPDDAALFRRAYGVEPGGNFEGRSILYRPHGDEAIAGAEGIEVGELRERLAVARGRLRDVRSEREAPFRDEKVLVAWSALAVRALAEAGGALDRDPYVAQAIRSGSFLWEELRSDDRLLHTWFRGRASVPGFLDDHGALGNAFLSLHAVTLEPVWLERAAWLCDEILSRFRDPETGLLYDTAHDAERLVVRPRDPTDGATPSGSSLAAELLLRAAHLFDEARYRDAAAEVLATNADVLASFGPAFGRMLSVLDRSLAEPVEVVVAGRRDDRATRALVTLAHGCRASNLTLAGTLEGEPAPRAPLFADRVPVDGRATAYVCRGYACRRPITEPAELRSELAAAP